jgi:hypothetical protein
LYRSIVLSNAAALSLAVESLALSTSQVFLRAEAPERSAKRGIADLKLREHARPESRHRIGCMGRQAARRPNWIALPTCRHCPNRCASLLITRVSDLQVCRMG